MGLRGLVVLWVDVCLIAKCMLFCASFVVGEVTDELDRRTDYGRRFAFCIVDLTNTHDAHITIQRTP